jgi:hypothetical protein
MRIRSGATDADLVGFRREALSLLNVGNHPFVERLFDVRKQGRDTVPLMEYVAPESGCTTLQDCIDACAALDSDYHRIRWPLFSYLLLCAPRQGRNRSSHLSICLCPEYQQLPVAPPPIPPK